MIEDTLFYLGSTEPEQMLCVLVYAAAEIGGQQFIAMIFNSSAGKVVYDCYKDSSVFPEAIAREYGHEKTATFLEEITGRYSFALDFGMKRVISIKIAKRLGLFSVVIYGHIR